MLVQLRKNFLHNCKWLVKKRVYMQEVKGRISCFVFPEIEENSHRRRPKPRQKQNLCKSVKSASSACQKRVRSLIQILAIWHVL